jgi:hypothetical protein
MPRYSDQQLAEALRAARGMVYVASKRLGCSDNTVRDRFRRSRALQAVVEEASGLMLDTTELKLYEAVLRGEPWAIQFTLKTKGKSRGYTERCEHVVAQVSIDPEHARVRLEQMLDQLHERREADLRRREQLAARDCRPAEVEASSEVIEVVSESEPAPLPARSDDRDRCATENDAA